MDQHDAIAVCVTATAWPGPATTQHVTKTHEQLLQSLSSLVSSKIIRTMGFRFIKSQVDDIWMGGKTHFTQSKKYYCVLSYYPLLSICVQNREKDLVWIIARCYLETLTVVTVTKTTIKRNCVNKIFAVDKPESKIAILGLSQKHYFHCFGDFLGRLKRAILDLPTGARGLNRSLFRQELVGIGIEICQIVLGHQNI